MIPADRRDEQRGQGADRQAREGVAGPVQQRRGGKPQHPGREGDAQPQRLPARDATGQSGERAAQGLVHHLADESGPAGLQEVAVQPPLHGRARQQREPGDYRGHERRRRRRGLPEPAGDQQVHDEDERHQLDAGQDAGSRALPPSPVRLAQVPDDDRHLNEFDLAQIQGSLYRLQPERDANHQQGRAGPRRAPPAKLAKRDADRHHQRGGGHHGRHVHQRPERQWRYQREDERGKGGVRELDTRLLLPGIQARRILPDQYAAHPVNAQVEPLQHADRRVSRQRGQVQPRSHGSHHDTDREQHPMLPPPLAQGSRATAGQVGAGPHRWSSCSDGMTPGSARSPGRRVERHSRTKASTARASSSASRTATTTVPAAAP